ncbi:DMT family transporter [Mesorhizobium sp. M7A.F.Ca.US.001.04.2.1]|uniref:DMT family transporter n=3 Tax=unclassified Mesorhizobium TaxID=325217 RepID=UPI000FCB9C1A|nr:DMT family transporter [Mesorhizobium sp. M7A.F.Ca.US.001.04.2.1]RUY22867.1 DMT family transporter [Mesorhizobium sp. M7A.F.Ca.US.001.04.2.1]
MRPRDVLLATLPPVLWAIAYTVAKPAMERFPPLFLMSIVYAATALALYRPWQLRLTPLWAVVAAATLGASLQSALIFSGIARVPATMAILTVQSQVPFAVLAAWLVGQEQTNARRLAGVIIALAGVTLVVGLPSSVGESGGLALIVLGTLCWGIAQAIIRTKSQDSGARLMGMMAAIAAPQLLIMSLVLERGQQAALFQATQSQWGAVAVLALGGFVAAYSIWYGLLRQHRVDQIAPFILLMPIFGVLTAHVLLGEAITPVVLAGGSIILIGLILVVCTPTAEEAVETKPLPLDVGNIG